MGDATLRIYFQVPWDDSYHDRLEELEDFINKYRFKGTKIDLAIERQEDVPRLFRYRYELMQMATKGQSHLMIDDDFVFMPHSDEYYLDCMIASNLMKSVTGLSAVINCGGVLGAAANVYNFLHAPVALFATVRGILVDSEDTVDWFRKYDLIKGGFEDPFMSFLAMWRYNAVPLKRFLCPTKARAIHIKKGLQSGSIIPQILS